MRIIPFHPEHLGLLDYPNEGYRDVAARGCGYFMELAPRGLAKTVFGPGGVALGVLAAVPRPDEDGPDGACEVLLLPSVAVLAWPVAAYRATRSELARIRRQFARIYAMSSTAATSQRFLERLGFVCDGPVNPATRPGCGGKLMWRLA